MSDQAEERKTAARRKAENQFTASGQRDAQLRDEIEKKRLAVAAKTARLRALRLAKEAAESTEKTLATSSSAAPAAKTTRKLRARPAQKG